MGSDENTISPTRTLLLAAWGIFREYWVLLIPLFISFRFLCKRYVSPLRDYPGPFLASCSRIWKLMSTASERTHLDHIALHRKYGPIVRVAPNELSFASPMVARNVLSAGKRFYKTDFYSVFPPPENPDIFTEVREDVHAMKKKVANVPYSMAAMKQLSPFIDDTIDFLVSRLDQFCPDTAIPGFQQAGLPGRNTIVNLGDWLHFFAFDVLGEVAFGRSFGFMAAGVDKEGAIKTIDNSQKYNGIVGQIPEVDILLRRNPLWRWIPAFNPENALITRIAREELAKRRPFEIERDGKGASSDGREDLLSSLIRGHLKDKTKFHEGDIFAVSHGAIFAGSDSTASTMQSFFYQVLSSPRVYMKLINEIEAATRDGTIAPQGNVQWTEAQNLPYFQACLKEAMRLRPAVGVNIQRYVPPEGIEVEGRHLPGGTRLSLNGWVLHRDKATFGQDAEFYRPERWLDDPENAKVMERYMFQFGGGAHVCIGRNLALLEINKVIPRLLRDFEFELAYPGRELKAKATFFVVQEGLEVYISRKSLAEQQSQLSEKVSEKETITTTEE